MIDTGKNAPESLMTLLHQQQALVDGHRKVQMFPIGTDELPLPWSINRHENDRGVFHYRTYDISPLDIDELSSKGRENEFLNLGPYNKADIAKRLENGETLVFITEYTPMGVEVRSAAGTNKTIDTQFEYFERTKERGNTIVTGAPPERVLQHLRKAS